jgi:hypothetical protein
VARRFAGSEQEAVVCTAAMIVSYISSAAVAAEEQVIGRIAAGAAAFGRQVETAPVAVRIASRGVAVDSAAAAFEKQEAIG